jgi:hypothetical protein
MTKPLPVFALALYPLLAANEGALFSAGYSAPGIIEVAPGQVVTLFFRGVTPIANGVLRSAQAQTVPLPITLAGLSVSILQAPQTTPYPVPVLAVRQQNECEEVSFRPVCLLTAVRVQIPSELTPTVAKLTIDVDGEPSRTYLVRPIRDNAHVLTACDLTWDTNPAAECNRMAFHADGTRVDAQAPAKPGEMLVIYAHGLGPTTPRVPAGTAAPVGVALTESVARQLKASFIVFRNAPGGLPRYFETEAPGMENAVTYAGLTQGQVGLYQINVKVPATLELPILCGGETKSNVIAKIATAQGVENVALCVVP